MTIHWFVFSLLACAIACAESSSPEPDGQADPAGDAEGLDPSETLDPDAAENPGDGPCEPGETLCDGVCVDTRTHHDHCGGCSQACEPAEACSGGVCLFECPSGTVACSGSCVDIMTDTQHCGACGVVCTAGLHAEPVCELGICGVICEEGWTDLDGDGSCESDCTPTSTVEICNGVDDNCNGLTDESFECRMGREVGCTTVCGSTGTGLCGIDCTPPPPASCSPPAELCNGLDDDCNGACDNGYTCCRGESGSCTSSCGTAGSRVCSATCDWSNCMPPPETCNGEDDDCDGACDNGTGMACCAGLSGSCTTSCGSTGSRTCSTSCTWGTCTPPGETCNGADDDCDGTCDDGFACCRGSSEPCTTTCSSTGTHTCTSSCAWGTCNPPAETCNGSDDDCDGTPDDLSGCTIPVYRFLCGSDHFYKNNASVPSGCSIEGAGNPVWHMYSSAVSGTSFSTTPLYRLYKGSVPDHFYTTSDSEKASAMSSGYVDEGNIGNCSPSAVSGKTTPLYRLVSLTSGEHFYTTSAAERDNAVAVYHYQAEGTACHVFPNP
jgi:hypothetical protein